MTADERIATVRLKIERAEKHIRDLDAEIVAFLKENPYPVSRYQDPTSGYVVHYVDSVRPIPPAISLIAGDAIANIRSALDHLAYQLFLVGSGEGDGTHVYFPIFDSVQEYEAKSGRKIKGMSEEAKRAIAAVKPYLGGNLLLWQLHKLNNLDKHRLIVTVFARLGTVNFPDAVGDPSIQERMRTEQTVWWDGKDIIYRLPGVFDVRIPFIGRGLTVKEGDVLLIESTPDAKAHENIEFTFGISLDEARIIKRKPLVETLHQMANMVSHVLTAFEPLLS